MSNSGWGLTDPAAVQGTDEERLAAFRMVRDELAMRIKALFPCESIQ
jgi:arsenate reductase